MTDSEFTVKRFQVADAFIGVQSQPSQEERMTKVANPCLNTLHDNPLPPSYLGAHEEAESRLSHGWRNIKCPFCGLYGWRSPEGLSTAAKPDRKFVDDLGRRWEWCGGVEGTWAWRITGLPA